MDKTLTYVIIGAAALWLLMNNQTAATGGQGQGQGGTPGQGGQGGTPGQGGQGGTGQYGTPNQGAGQQGTQTNY